MWSGFGAGTTGAGGGISMGGPSLGEK